MSSRSVVAAARRIVVKVGSSLVTNGGQGLDRIPQQFRADASAPVGLLGRSGDPNAFEVHAKGRSAAGRTRVRLQSEARTWGTAFDVAGLASTAWTPLGAPLTTGTSVSPLSVHHSGLATLEHYKWRARIASASPYFPWTPWLSPQGNGREQHDLRAIPLLAAGLSVPQATTRELRLAPPSPNPFRTATTLLFTLSEREHVSLSVYDISGRRVALLVDSARDAGAHHVEWDGRSDTGKRTGDGIYFVRFVSGGETRTQKVVMVH